MNVAQRVFFNTGIQVVARGLGLFVSLLVLRLTTHYLGVQQFGQLSIILALGELLRVIADLGVGTTLAREIAKTPEETDALGGNLLRFRVSGSGAAVLLALVVIPVLPYSHETKVGLALSLVGVFFASVASFPNAFFQTNLRLELQAALDIATKLLNLTAILVVSLAHLGFYALVGSLVVVNGVICALAFAFSRRLWRINLRFEWARAKLLIRDAAAIGVASMIGLLHFKGDAILLSLLKPAKDVGIYAVAYRFIDQAFFLPGLFVAAVFPILTRSIHRSAADGEAAINRTFQVLVLGGVTVSAMIFVLARPLVHLAASEAFDESILPLRLLSLAIMFIFVSSVFYNALIAVNRQRELIAMGVASLVFNVALNLVLIPRYSYDGAAAATVVSEGVSFLGTFVIAKRFIGFRLDTAFLARAFFATAAAAGAAALTWRTSAWLAFVLSEAVFLGAAYAVGAVTRADLRMILQRSPS